MSLKYNRKDILYGISSREDNAENQYVHIGIFMPENSSKNLRKRYYDLKNSNDLLEVTYFFNSPMKASTDLNSS